MSKPIAPVQDPNSYVTCLLREARNYCLAHVQLPARLKSCDANFVQALEKLTSLPEDQQAKAFGELAVDLAKSTEFQQLLAFEITYPQGKWWLDRQTTYSIHLLKEAEKLLRGTKPSDAVKLCDEKVAERLKNLPTREYQRDQALRELALGVAKNPGLQVCLAAALSCPFSSWLLERKPSYLSRLVEEAEKYFRTKELPQELKQCDDAISYRIRAISGHSVELIRQITAPQDFQRLAQRINYDLDLSKEAEPDLARLLRAACKCFRYQELPPDLPADELKVCSGIKKLGEFAAIEVYALAHDLEQDPRYQELLAFAINYVPSKWLLEQEHPYLRERRVLHRLLTDDKDAPDPYQWASKNDVQGICLSGGGIRSATFNLGVIQGLANLDLLKNFDYLSSVSGGGYIHQFLAAWIKREEERIKQEKGQVKEQPEGAKGHFKAGDAGPDRGYYPGDGFRAVTKLLDPIPNKYVAGFHPEPIKWLRRYSNYLTPTNGVFSADTWVAIAIWLRNTFLNQIVLLSGLLMLVLLARLMTLTFRHTVSLFWLDIGVGFLFAIVAVYLALALHREYIRIRGKDIEEEMKKSEAAQSSEQKSKGVAWLDKRCKAAILWVSERKVIKAATARLMTWDWIGGEYAALTLGVLPFLLAACLSLCTLWPAPLAHYAPPVDREAYGFLFSCLFVVTLVIGFAGGAWREYAIANEKTLMGISPGGTWVCLYSAFMAALLGTAAFAGIWKLGDRFTHTWELIAVFGPPLLLSIPFLTLVFGAGLVGRDFPDWMREWLARIRAWSLMLGLFWMLGFGIVLLGPFLVAWLRGRSGAWLAALKWSTVLAWVGTTAGSLLASKSAKVSGEKDSTQANSALDLLAVVGPYVYILGLLILLSWGALRLVELRGPECASTVFLALIGAAAFFALFGFRIDINEFSLNSFYRNRLTRCYLGATNSNRQPSPLTGFDDRDTRGLQISRLLPKTPPVLEKVQDKEDPTFTPYAGPFPIICATLNLTFGEDLAWQERKAASFAFTPLYSGYTVGWTSGKRGQKLSFNGFVPTYNYAFPDGGISISSAVAISGAAASPNWGYHTNPATAFLMTMFDVRLGWWVRNPRKLIGLAGASPLVQGRVTDRATPRFAPIQLVKELLGMTDDTSDYVYLSDGGHFDNMGLYELVRRRCYRILICDGEEDEKYVFEGLGSSIRKCRIDFGVEITLSNVKDIRLDPTSNYSHAHFATGTILYPEQGSSSTRREGTILYLKLSLTGTGSYTRGSEDPRPLSAEPADIFNYKLQHDAFPHDTTLNQWFTESQFESYRRLGAHVVEEIQTCGLWSDFTPRL